MEDVSPIVMPVVGAEAYPRTMAARPLRAVDTEPAPTTPGTVEASAKSSTRHLLMSLRDRIAAQIDEGVHPRDLAALSRRLLEISRELDALGDPTKDRVQSASVAEDEPYG